MMPTSLMFQHKMSSLHGCDTQNYLVALVKRKGSWSKSTMSQLIDTLHFSLEILKSYFLISLTICNNELSFFTKIQIVGRNLWIVAHWWTFCESYMYGVFQRAGHQWKKISKMPKKHIKHCFFFSFEWNLHILQNSRS